jgi:hypothetical protein
MTLQIPKTTAALLTELTGELRPEAALLLIVKDAVAYRLEKIAARLKVYEDKYGMSFAQYRQLWETEDRPEHYTYKAEMDYLEWEGLVTREKRLRDAFAWLP